MRMGSRDGGGGGMAPEDREKEAKLMAHVWLRA